MENENLVVDLAEVYHEINEEFMDRMINDIRDRTFRIAKTLANKFHNSHIHQLPYIVQKQILAEAADIVSNQIIEESQGKIY